MVHNGQSSIKLYKRTKGRTVKNQSDSMCYGIFASIHLIMATDNKPTPSKIRIHGLYLS